MHAKKMCLFNKLVSAFVICALLVYNKCGSGSRILASVNTPSFSHQVAFRQIWKELAKRGHDVVLITTDPMTEEITNLRQIDASSSYGEMKSDDLNAMIANNTFANPIELVKYLVGGIIKVNYHQFQLPEVQALIQNKSEMFDLFMTEVTFPGHLGFMERFDVPVIGLISLDAPHMMYHLMGSEAHPVLQPESYIVPVSYPLNLWQRIVNSIVRILVDVHSHLVIKPKLNEMIRFIFGENARSIDDLSLEVDMLFVNTNPVFHHIRALTPNTISFGGGSHVESTQKQLPMELLEFLENAPNGVVYFSLGSNVKSNLLNDDLKKVFMETFAELPYKVLWKFESGHLLNKSDNVMIQKWVPQNDIFKHPNVKLFVTQCGLQSIEEAIMNHVPLVGLPFFGDQPANGNVLQKKSLGITLDYKTVTKEVFKETIIEVMTNPK
ncbi:hypothetical protein WA026_014796 [Henosepilachna vigintioctopunctata]|uniref:Glucuronosyltransferase n=1 Tax=Henosepilachna vigintioctopunctata TaxID=420089 RepID=A0AAW1V1A7_9CUCU